jgi:hypothetical protein
MPAAARPSKAAAPAPVAPAEITVPVLGELVAYQNRQADFDAFRAIGGRAVATWSATKQAGTTLATAAGLNAVEMWALVEDGSPFVVLARFTRKSRGTVAHAEIVGAARTVPAPDTDEVTDAASTTSTD